MKKLIIILASLLVLASFASAEVFSIDYTVSTNSPAPVYTVGQPFKVTSVTAFGATGNITVSRIHKGFTNTFTVASNSLATAVSNWPVFVSGDSIVLSGGGHGTIVSLEGTR